MTRWLFVALAVVASATGVAAQMAEQEVAKAEQARIEGRAKPIPPCLPDSHPKQVAPTTWPEGNTQDERDVLRTQRTLNEFVKQNGAWKQLVTQFTPITPQ